MTGDRISEHEDGSPSQKAETTVRANSKKINALLIGMTDREDRENKAII